MRFPWSSSTVETRASYTSALLDHLYSQAQGRASATVAATAGVEAASSFYGRAFQLATVTADRPMVADVLTPALMGMVGRSLVRRGELVLYIDMTGDGLALLPVNSYEVADGPSLSTWVYLCHIATPSGRDEQRVAAMDGVVHLRYATDPARPWRGIGPLEAASLAGKLSAETSAALADESSGPMHHFLPMPVDGEDDTVAELKVDIQTNRGGAVLVEAGDWDKAQSGQNTADWHPRRLGANPPQPLVMLQELAFREVVAACGLNASMLFSQSDGTMSRESFRQAGTAMEATARPVSEELTRKLDSEVTLDLQPLRSSDVQGRARGFAAMVGAGMELERAVALSGLMMADDSP